MCRREWNEEKAYSGLVRWQSRATRTEPKEKGKEEDVFFFRCLCHLNEYLEMLESRGLS